MLTLSPKEYSHDRKKANLSGPRVAVATLKTSDTFIIVLSYMEHAHASDDYSGRLYRRSAKISKGASTEGYECSHIMAAPRAEIPIQRYGSIAVE